MSKQEIPNSGGDYISPTVDENWMKGPKPPAWAEPTILTFQDEAVVFSGEVLAFKDYK